MQTKEIALFMFLIATDSMETVFFYKAYSGRTDSLQILL